ncbi:50S ribosomal protein L25 [Polaromonas sp.]|nr:50S ribosomal protein L25 [Candidatus Saccharibacteria bacterium]
MSQDTISLQVTNREVTGKAVKHLRKAGTIPAVIHDHGKPSINIQGDFVAMTKIWRQAGKHHPVSLTNEGKKYTALIKTATFDPRKHLLTHIVFNAVSATEKVEAEIPVRARYNEGNDSSPAERTGYIVLSQLDAVMVSAIASKLPDYLEYDAEKLVDVGDHVTVADLIIPDGVEVKIEAEHTLATVFEPSALAAANEDAGGDAPEDAPAPDSEQGTDADTTGNEAEDKPGGKDQAQPKGE